MTDDRPIPSRTPTVEVAAAGTYNYCTCGRSGSQPFCDGSHAGTGYSPLVVVLEEERKVAWCNCKRTSKAPYCDGTHAKLPPE
ncbi:MAG TPA: CDGSH iron-sulfur domain-containing protein [Planctomycetes bacterium]|nr:CDGSH iron-sulfur domain-containing protein [Planctomycetota bacterium]